MITLHHTPILAALVGTLTLGLHLPAQAQHLGSEGRPAQIDAVMPARTLVVDPATAQAFDMAPAFDMALQDYERCHWLRAFEQLVLLADQGHAGAARMAMQMHQHGPKLYGQPFALLPGQAERFARARLPVQISQPTGAQ